MVRSKIRLRYYIQFVEQLLLWQLLFFFSVPYAIIQKKGMVIWQMVKANNSTNA